MIRASIDRNTDPFCADAANANRLSLAGRILSEIIGCDCGCLFLTFVRQRKQFFDGDLERTRDLEGYFCVRHIASRFNRIDGLTSDAYLICEFRRPNTASFANRDEIGLYAAHYFLSCTISSLFNIRTDRAARLSRGATSRNAPLSPKSGLSFALSARRTWPSVNAGSSSPTENRT